MSWTVQSVADTFKLFEQQRIGQRDFQNDYLMWFYCSFVLIIAHMDFYYSSVF